MDNATIIRLLTNSGFNVKGIDASQTHILLEDPSCILRNFETFLEYAWVIVTLITVIMLFGWAISKIRGANTDITTNIRNLIIMFGVLSATGPIVNLIYGGDLMSRTCHIIQVPIAEVQKILDARNAHMSANDSLFEGIDIFDSGARDPNTTNDLEPVDVPHVTFQEDPETGEYVPVYEEEPDSEQNEPDDSDTGEAEPNPEPIEPVQNNSNDPISARTISNRVIEYTRANATTYRHNGGTPAWRHTNPGNIVNGSFTLSHGAIGQGRRFAIFPSVEVGKQAIISLLRSSSYNNLSIIDAIKRYAPEADHNKPVQYAQTISRETGLDVNRKLNTLNDAEIRKVADIIHKVEGWQPGTVTQ